MSSHAPTTNAFNGSWCVMANTIVAMSRTKRTVVCVHIRVTFCAMRCRGRAGKRGPLSADRSSFDICVQNRLVFGTLPGYVS